ncbi:MAG TPA: penicillin-insensitive murein endopeptidase [Kofleriaceae bacterium]|nr:penicillin-insensitive murein endopeptidase [Kofleriaceae bacterium]
MLIIGAALIASGSGPRARADRLPAERAATSERPGTAPGGSGSLSCGAVNRGALAAGRAMPDRGPGYATPGPWRERGLRYGTDELVGMVERAAAEVARRHPGGTLAIADLSAEGGGAVARHRSHQSGRDVDLIYYAIDRAGEPLPNDGHMPVYARSGRATHAESPEWAPRIPERFFDLPRNWALVEALLTDPEAEVQRIFVARSVRDWLIAYATAAGRPPQVIERARAVLVYPRDVKGHSDHMHVRIACSAEDVEAGRCSDDPAPRRRRGKWRSRVRCGAESDRVADR